MNDDRYLREGEEHSDGPAAILRTFVLQNKVKTLSGLASLSYVAGREGDDDWEWAAEADDALCDAFGWPAGNGTRAHRFAAVKRVLSFAFYGGRAQREIDLSVAGRTGSAVLEVSPQQLKADKVCDRAMGLARAHATIYADEIVFPADRHPHAIESEIGYVTTKIAQRHAVTDAEAAYCALKAFEERGFEITFEAAETALDRAAAGRADREADEADMRERAAGIELATAGLFGEDE